MFEFEENFLQGADIAVIGVGGGGGNAINNMLSSNLKGVEFIAANTDIQALNANRAPRKIQLGKRLTRGKGCGSDPELGRQAAIEDADEIREALQNFDMVFITAGMGGGTGTGGAPVIASMARELGALTVGVVTKPFHFEGKPRMLQAERGIMELQEQVDTLIVIPNQNLLNITGKKTSILEAFKKVDDILYQAVKGISDLITQVALINLDFADVKSIMKDAGFAIMGVGVASGENRAVEAADKAINNPLLEDVSIGGAKGVLINITASSNLGITEAADAVEPIRKEADEDAKIIFGAALDDSMGDELQVTVIATGFGRKTEAQRKEPHIHLAYEAPKQEDDLESPAFLRKANTEKAMKKPKSMGIVIDESVMDDKDYNIPAFYRRQAD